MQCEKNKQQKRVIVNWAKLTGKEIGRSAQSKGKLTNADDEVSQERNSKLIAPFERAPSWQ